MPNCPQCNSPTRPGAKFCARCGAAISSSAPLAATPLLPHFQIEPPPAVTNPLTPAPPGHQYALFGFRFEALPDWLNTPDILNRLESDRLAAVLQNWQQFINNLWKWKGAAFALRFISRPDQGSIEAVLLVRVRLGTHTRPVAEALAADLSTQLIALYLSPVPLTDSAALAEARRPVSFNCMLEVRQQESLARLNLGDAYMVYPLGQPAGDFRLVFETLLRTSRPTLLSLYLEPTELTSGEQSDLSQAASIAQSLADFQYSGHFYLGRWQDPQAALVGEIYSSLLHRLGQPFLCAAHVAGDDIPAAWSVARAMESGLTVQPATVNPPRQAPIQCEIVPAQTPPQRQAMQAALATLTLSQWGPTQAVPGKIRLRYLTDAAGAASLVRFPVVGKGGAPGLRVKQVAPVYNQGPQRQQVAPHEVSLGQFLNGGLAAIARNDLTRHGLITGFTGSGKTNTCLYLLDQLWRQQRLPVLIIEPAKSEYRGLIGRLGFENLLVFTLGDEAVSPFRLNPFELLPGVRLETHLSALKTCFNAALPQFGVLPTIVEEALIRIYQEKSWQLTDQLQPNDSRLFPTMRDMFAAVIRVAEERDYSGEVRDNIRAAAAGRIGSLLSGSKGRMFGCQHSIPMATLLNGPVVLELDALNDNEKALAMMFLLTHLREYCKTQRPDGRLAHITLIEEAHRVLEETASVAGSEVAADTRAEAVRFFSGALAEIRAYGEGILIAEQSPGKLAPDAVRNTNLKITHMLLDSKDREAIAGAMMMDDEQKQFIGKLPVGQAALFMTGYEKATFIRVPPLKGSGYNERLHDDAVIRHMQPFRAQHAAAYLPFDGCRFCGSPCQYRSAIEPVTLNKELSEAFKLASNKFELYPEKVHWADNWRNVTMVCAEAGKQAGHTSVMDAAWCYLAHKIDFPFTLHMRQSFERASKTIGS